VSFWKEIYDSRKIIRFKVLKMEIKKSVQSHRVDFKAYRDARNSGVVLVSPETVGSRNIWMGVGFLAPAELGPSGAHEPEEALFILQGSGVVSVDGQETPVKAGTGIYIPPNVAHSLRNTGKTSMIFVVSMTNVQTGNLVSDVSGELCFNCGG